MTDETTTSADTTTSPVATTTASDGDATVLGGTVAQEATTDAPAADTTTTDANAATEPTAPVVPEKYEFTLEGVTFDPEVVAAADPVLRELGLSNEAANKLAPLAQQVMERTSNALIQQLQDQGAAQRKEWLDAFAADPEIGGAQRAETEAFAAKGLDALGYTKDHPFRAALNDSGFGNHPDMIRAFRRLGELVGEEGTFARAGAVTAQKPVWERMYPNDVK